MSGFSNNPVEVEDDSSSSNSGESDSSSSNNGDVISLGDSSIGNDNTHLLLSGYTPAQVICVGECEIGHIGYDPTKTLVKKPSKGWPNLDGLNKVQSGRMQWLNTEAIVGALRAYRRGLPKKLQDSVNIVELLMNDVFKSAHEFENMLHKRNSRFFDELQSTPYSIMPINWAGNHWMQVIIHKERSPGIKRRYTHIRHLAVCDRYTAGHVQNVNEVHRRLKRWFNKNSFTFHRGYPTNLWVPRQEGHDSWSCGPRSYWIGKQFMDRLLALYEVDQDYHQSLWNPMSGWFDNNFVRGEMIGRLAWEAVIAMDYKARIAVEVVNEIREKIGAVLDAGEAMRPSEATNKEPEKPPSVGLLFPKPTPLGSSPTLDEDPPTLTPDTTPDPLSVSPGSQEIKKPNKNPQKGSAPSSSLLVQLSAASTKYLTPSTSFSPSSSSNNTKPKKPSSSLSSSIGKISSKITTPKKPSPLHEATTYEDTFLPKLPEFKVTHPSDDAPKIGSAPQNIPVPDTKQPSKKDSAPQNTSVPPKASKPPTGHTSLGDQTSLDDSALQNIFAPLKMPDFKSLPDFTPIEGKAPKPTSVPPKASKPPKGHTSLGDQTSPDDGAPQNTFAPLKMPNFKKTEPFLADFTPTESKAPKSTFVPPKVSGLEDFDAFLADQTPVQGKAPLNTFVPPKVSKPKKGNASLANQTSAAGTAPPGGSSVPTLPIGNAVPGVDNSKKDNTPPDPFDPSKMPKFENFRPSLPDSTPIEGKAPPKILASPKVSKVKKGNASLGNQTPPDGKVFPPPPGNTLSSGNTFPSGNISASIPTMPIGMTPPQGKKKSNQAPKKRVTSKGALNSPNDFSVNFATLPDNILGEPNAIDEGMMTYQPKVPLPKYKFPPLPDNMSITATYLGPRQQNKHKVAPEWDVKKHYISFEGAMPPRKRDPVWPRYDRTNKHPMLPPSFYPPPPGEVPDPEPPKPQPHDFEPQLIPPPEVSDQWT